MAKKLRVMVTDNASPDIIEQTYPGHLEYVRLYFRPRTPTQYRNEGIRPVEKRELGAHCPVPVYFCFDALTVLAQDNTEFSDGNMGSPQASHSDSREFFFHIPFEQVFHDGAFPPAQRDSIVFHRNAEVLIPEKLPLGTTLKFIACRTAAERQTLLQLLPPDLRSQWVQRVRLADQGLFERRWTFVEEVVAIDERIVFRFNPSSKTPGPFDTEFSYRETGSETTRNWRGQGLSLDSQLSLRLPGASQGTATLTLDDALAFCGLVTFEEIPF
jgi:hypothetical protein